MAKRPEKEPWVTPRLRTISAEEIARRPELRRAMAEERDATSPDAARRTPFDASPRPRLSTAAGQRRFG